MRQLTRARLHPNPQTDLNSLERGSPKRTRNADLCRVKVARRNHLRANVLKRSRFTASRCARRGRTVPVPWFFCAPSVPAVARLMRSSWSAYRTRNTAGRVARRRQTRARRDAQGAARTVALLRHRTSRLSISESTSSSGKSKCSGTDEREPQSAVSLQRDLLQRHGRRVPSPLDAVPLTRA